MSTTQTLLRSTMRHGFFWAMSIYALLVLAMMQTGSEIFEHLHLDLDTSNAILSALLAMFLLGERHQISAQMRNYLVLCFSFAAATETLHALIGIEWSGPFSWIVSYAGYLRPATWPPSTYILPLGLVWAAWIEGGKRHLAAYYFGIGLMALTLLLMWLSLSLPRYVDTGMLGIQRPTQVPLLLLWGWAIVIYWRKRHEHQLFEGIALMGVLLLLSDLCMLYSTSPHEKFTMMAHLGKLVAYVFLHFVQMRVAVEDAHARDIAEAALRDEQAQLRATLDELRYQKFALDQHAIVGITDVQGSIVYANERFCDISGYSRDELLGKNHRILKSGTHPPEFFQDMYRCIAAGKVWRGEICNRAKSGAIYWVETTIVPFLNEQGKPTRYIAMRTDITARKLSEAQIHNLAFFDTLTGLANRRLSNDRLQQALASHHRSGQYGALMFIDLDNFKPLNDTYGHGAGDLLLIEVAQRLNRCVREADSVARFGGDEFVVILHELGSDARVAKAQATTIAEKIRAALSEPYLLHAASLNDTGSNIQHRCTSSIGITLFTGRETAEAVLKQADAAMYRAKEAGRNTLYSNFVV